MTIKTLPCASCKYNGFRGLVQTCRHPEHLDPIGGKLTLLILGNGGKCADHIDWEKKVNSIQEITWPLPVIFAED